MSHYQFIYNLCKPTYQARVKGFVDPSGYLLSIHRYSPQFVRFACDLDRQHLETLFADNGFFRRIRLLADRFAPQGKRLLTDIVQLEKGLDRKIRQREIPSRLRAQYQALARRVRQAVYDEEKTIDFPEIIREQQLIHPDVFIVPEDILQAVLISLNLEPEYLGLGRRFYRYRNHRAARNFQKLELGKWGEYEGEPYAVASAVDFNTAYDAGREMAARKIKRLAIGVGAYMADDHYADHYVVGRKTFALPRTLPRRYTRTALVIKGLLECYHQQGKTHPQAVHFLGLGAPIMILVASLLSRKVRRVSFDATSPIKDAVQGTLYSTEPTYLKMRTRKLALWYCQHPEQDWDCTCVYCRHFLKQFPMKPKQAAAWYQKQGNPAKITKLDLRHGQPLAKSFPLFAEGGPERGQIEEWRIGHNHMMLEREMANINLHQKKGDLPQFAERKIDNYLKRATSTYAAAIDFAFQLAIRKSPR